MFYRISKLVLVCFKSIKSFYNGIIDCSMVIFLKLRRWCWWSKRFAI